MIEIKELKNKKNILIVSLFLWSASKFGVQDQSRVNKEQEWGDGVGGALCASYWAGFSEQSKTRLSLVGMWPWVQVFWCLQVFAFGSYKLGVWRYYWSPLMLVVTRAAGPVRQNYRKVGNPHCCLSLLPQKNSHGHCQVKWAQNEAQLYLSMSSHIDVNHVKMEFSCLTLAPQTPSMELISQGTLGHYEADWGPMLDCRHLLHSALLIF